MSLVSEMRLSIERLTGDDALGLVEPLFREYLPWAFGRLASECGVRFDDPEGVAERHHSALAAEMPNLLDGRGRLLLARLDGEPVGVAALKPVEHGIAEIKRMFVRPWARGRGVGKALLLRLVGDARTEGCRSVRLETLAFLSEARALYRSFGFVDTGAFDRSELDMAGLARLACYMELPLRGAG